MHWIHIWFRILRACIEFCAHALNYMWIYCQNDKRTPVLFFWIMYKIYIFMQCAPILRSKIHILFLRAYAWNCEIFYIDWESVALFQSTVCHSQSQTIDQKGAPDQMHVTYTVQKTEFAPATRMIEHWPMWRFYSMTMLYHATLRSHRRRSRISAANCYFDQFGVTIDNT